MAFGSSFGISLGCDCASPFDSLASTFCVSAGGVGNGILLTSVALMAPPPPAVPPQLSPRLLGIKYPNKANPNSAACSATEPITGARRLPPVGKMSTSAAIRLQRLRHNTHIGDAGLFHGVHDGCECAKGNVFISANKHGLAFGVPNLLMQLRADLVDVDWVVIEEDALLPINGD